MEVTARTIAATTTTHPMMDEDKYIKLFGVSLGWGKRLRWPDDYFQLSTQLSYTRYMLRDWSYFLISNGNCNNINLGITLSRTSTDNQLFPRRGSEFMMSGNTDATLVTLQ